MHHYSIHAERSYLDSIVRFVRFHSIRSREDLFDLALHGTVAAATQNQALIALAKSPTKTPTTQANHFALRAKLYLAANRAAFQQLQQIKSQLIA